MIELHSTIISGDHEKPTRALSRELGIDYYFAETFPENKADMTEQLTPGSNTFEIQDISGHSDVLMGSVTADESYVGVFEDFYSTMEIFASPGDCYLALRGLRTLPVRLRQHEKAALEIAKWLKTTSLVEYVLHPALPDHPQHHIWKRDFTGSTHI